jgi:hypothetical protein
MFSFNPLGRGVAIGSGLTPTNRSIFLFVSIRLERVRPTKKAITTKRNQSVTNRNAGYKKRNHPIQWLRIFVTIA